MSATADTFDFVRGLLQQVPGVRVLDGDLSEGEVHFKVEVTGTSAIDFLQRLALSANVEVQPWLHDSPSNSVAQLTVAAQTLPRDTLACGELQMLGIHLVWHLHKKKLIPSSVANSLLQMWHAVGVEA